MTSLAVACLLFFLIHSLVSATGVRGALIGALGDKVYRALFSIVSLVAIVWMARSYNAASEAGTEVLWVVPGAVHAAMLLVLLAFLFAVVGVTTRSPTAMQQEALLRQDEPARGILRVTRHPFLVGVALWALGHLLGNGDVASVVFFGTFLLVALIGMPNIDRKRAKADPEGWARFAANTSRTPFLAIAQGRNRFSVAELGWWRIVLALVVYAAFLYFHGWIFGTPLMGR
jgi:uncharacterized membrane protein